MATIHVNRGGTNLGTFSEEEVRSGLQAGRFQATDLGWREGMAAWQPLSQFTEFAGDIAAGAAAAAPAPTPPTAGTPPSSPAPVIAVPEPPSGPRTGLPWENRNGQGVVAAFFETVRLVLTNPGQAFTQMKTSGGFTDPLLFGLIGGSIGVIIYTLFALMMHSLGLFASMASRESALNGMMGFGLGGAMIVFRLILTPIFIVIGLFIGAAITHLCLMMIGGARREFETTFRALSFAYGSTSLFLIAPCCGGLIFLVWYLVAQCIGLAKAHEIDTGRAVLAVFLPLILCCGALTILLMMIGGLTTVLQHANR